MMLRLLSIVVSLYLITFTTGAAYAKRVALVVGNSAYVHTPRLINPKNDAVDMAAALRRHGFSIIDAVDLDKKAFDRRVRDFAKELQGADAGLFFYAGHGLQVSGTNYLVPIDAELTGVDALEYEMVRVDAVQRIMEQLTNTNIIFLDACRDNPLARNLARAMGTRSVYIGRGLASVEGGIGTLISFSTQPGNVALDGDKQNSPFAKALLEQLASPPGDLSAILINVRNAVMRETGRKQVPWEHSALTGRFYFDPSQATAGSSAIVDGASLKRLQDGYAKWTALAEPVRGESEQAYIARMKQLVALSQHRPEPHWIRGHWAIGVWHGDVKAEKFGADGVARALNVANVKHDGSVFGGWAATSNRSFGLGAEIAIQGDRIHVKTQQFSIVTLQKSGNDRLIGTFKLKNGQTYPITLVRQ